MVSAVSTDIIVAALQLIFGTLSTATVRYIKLTTRFIYVLLSVVCSLITPLAQALDFIVNGQFNSAVSKGYQVQTSDTFGGYSIFANDGDWRIYYSEMSSTTGGRRAMQQPWVGMERYDEHGRWVMAQRLSIVIDPNGSMNGWSGEPCGGDKILKISIPRGRVDRCAASELKSIKIFGTDTEILRVTFTETNTGGRLYISTFDIHYGRLGLTRSEVADKSSDFNKQLKDWMDKFLDATVKAAGYDKPPDAFKRIQTFVEGTGISRIAKSGTAPRNGQELPPENEREKIALVNETSGYTFCPSTKRHYFGDISLCPEHAGVDIAIGGPSGYTFCPSTNRYYFGDKNLCPEHSTLDFPIGGNTAAASTINSKISTGYTFCPSTNRYYFGDKNLCPEHAIVNFPIGGNTAALDASGGEKKQKEQNAQRVVEETERIEQEARAKEKQRLANELEQARVAKAQKEAREKQAARLSIQATATKPDVAGDFVINIQTSADTASLTIDDEEQGANKTGVYTVRRVARVGATNIITISAKDIYGNTDAKTISVARQAVDSRPAFARLTPEKIKPQPSRDAVAIIIGIQNYKLIPKAEYANQDAQDFYDYASRALGINQENIKLLLDDEADVSGIFKAFQNWLPLKVRKGKTDVYVFYSGHGLPSADGKSLYFLPVGADKDIIAKTAISQKEIVDALKSAQPKSVTMFIDSCYSGQIRTGETLLASARPVVIKVDEAAYPPEFTVITASASDQIASSSPDLKHGIFSYYLMKGLEGEADENKDGTITIGKLQSYLAERVPRFAMTMSRKQEPQLVGDSARVLVSK